MSVTAHLGDCLKIMKTLEDRSVNLFVCDLPYGTITCEWDVKIDLNEFWKQVARLAVDDHTPVIMFCTTRFGCELINSNPSWFRYDLVWEKTNAVGFLSANKQPLRAHENIYVFSKAGAFYKRIDIKGDFPKGGGGRSKSNYLDVVNDVPNTGKTVEGVRCVKSVITYANKKKKNGHPTAKPIELYKWLIERYSNTGDTVLDPTAGSFNSCEAAMALDRHAIGIEMDNNYYNKACERLGLE